MNALRISCLFMGILALTSAYKGPIPASWHSHRNSIKNTFRATDWLTVSELETLPSINEMTIEKLEGISVQEGASWVNKIYHLSQAGRAFEASYAPKASEIPSYIITPDNSKVEFKLNELPRIAREEKHFDNEEVTVYITGLPEKSETIKKANRKLVQAYFQRYYRQAPRTQNIMHEDDKKGNSTSSEEGEQDYSNENSNNQTGTLVVIELGELLEDMQKYFTLDVERTGVEIANVLVQLIDKANVSHETIHVIGANVGAHVAGAVGRQFSRETGHKLRRITGLDPAKIFSQTDKALRGLARGDAEFVDVIHTSAYGLGTPTRHGNADFYPNGPSEGVPGADNVVEASMRAVRYFAESVVPGNERNFPAVTATSLEQYKSQQGHGKRAYMGIDTDYDVEGDFILQVNSKSPFGRGSSAHTMQNYHNDHQPWKMHSRGY